MQDVVIVGAGVVGAAAAYRLARAGASPTVLEAGRVGEGTSGATFSVDVSHVKTPRALFDLSMLGAREHRALGQELGGAPWLHRAGMLEWGATDAQRELLGERVARLRAWGHPAQWIAPARASELEPRLDARALGDAAVVHYPDKAWYEAPAMARALVGHAAELGADVHRGEAVTELSVTGRRVTAVRTASGRRLRAGIVVNCAGPDAQHVGGLAGARLAVQRVPGLVVSAASPEPLPNGIVGGPEVHVRPGAGGHVVLGSWEIDAMLDSEPSTPWRLAREVLARGAALFPDLRGARLEEAAVGVRPLPADGLPAVGPTPDLENLYTIVTHSAVHLAPVLGRLAAGEILTGREETMLAPFRPARLLEPGPLESLDESTREMTRRLGGANRLEPGGSMS